MIAVTWVAYGDSLHLPFFFDDMPHYVWLHGQTLGSIFVTAAGRPYYRPMQFFLWKVYETIFGVDSAMFYHALSLAVHAIDALLIVILVRRLDKDRDRGWPAILAAVVFALYPFSYQVVTLPASFTHPMVALCVLSSVLGYDEFRTHRQRRWLAASFVGGLLAFASNEGSLMLFGLIALVEWLHPQTNWRPAKGNRLKPVGANHLARFSGLRLSAADLPMSAATRRWAAGRNRWRWVMGFALMAVLYYVWYQTRPHEIDNGFGLRNLETIIQNSIYALQGLTFPLQPLGRVLMDWGMNDQAAVLIVAAITMMGLALLFARAKQIKPLVFGVGWYVFSLAAPVLILSHDYLINAPRVLYLGSIGTAYLYARAIAIVAAPSIVRRALTVAAALIVLVPSLVFVRQRMDLHTLNAAPLKAVLGVASQSQPDDDLLFVNLPAWISSMQAWYPIGHEGALFMPSYSTLADFVSTNLNRPSQAHAAKFTNLAIPQPYYYGLAGGAPLDWDQLNARVGEADRVYFTLYSTDKIELVLAGQPLRSSDSMAAARFDNGIVLEKAESAQCSDRLAVKLDWRSTQAITTDLHVFVHILNPDGTLAAQHDSPPLMGLFPFWQWHSGERIEDIHPIDMSALPPDRTYTIAVGLYDPGNGQRAMPTLPNGDRPADQAVRLGTFTPGVNDACR
jgi:hypothetical protein